MPRQYGPVLCREAAACDAAIRVEGDPHRAAVGVHRWWRHATTEPAARQKKTFEQCQSLSLISQLFSIHVAALDLVVARELTEILEEILGQAM